MISTARPTKFTPGSVRAAAVNEGVRLSTNPSSATLYSMCGWGKIVTDRNAYSTFLSMETTGSTQWNELITDTDGTTLILTDTSGQATVGAMTVGTWYFMGLSVSGTAAKAYFAAQGAASLTTVTRTISTVSPLSYVTIMSGDLSTAEWLNGEMARVRVWNAQLTDAEMLAEYKGEWAQKRTSLIGDWPMKTAADVLTDYSGLSHNLTSPFGGSALANGAAGPTIG